MKRILLPLFLALLIGCGDNDKEELKPAELVDFEEELTLKKLWSTSVGDGLGEYYQKLTLALADDTLYLADIEGVVAAIKTRNGKERWEVDIKEPISGGVGVGSGMVLIGTTKGHLIALKQEDGSELWRAKLSGEVLSAAKVAGDVVVVQVQDGHIVGLNRENGEQKWIYDSNMPVLSLRGSSAPEIVDGFVYAAFANGKVVCLSLTQGTVRWEDRVTIATGSSELERVIDVDGGLLIADNVLYAVSYQGHIVAIDLSNGKKIWKKSASSYVGLAEGFGNIYMSEAGDIVKALSRSGGTPVWTQEKLANRRLNTPAVIRNYLAVADFEGYVHLLSQIDGHFVARKKADGDGVRSDMIVDGDKIYIYGNSGKLVAWQIE